MDRNKIHVKGSPPKQPDTFISHPNLTPEEREERIRKADEESRKLTDWPNPDQ
ncbi:MULTISPECIES: hypothetical protein [Caproicibacterium]|jgi:hypothetical protein|uniref:Uncharacterized protein n=1 Tax=Caproicibacterium lactatifermentans TaxID=2666138 RepID=A0A859DQS5_9FIRM|nr:hypothetical protein [Caproicibacterium lactatifermentans]QKN24238.1 hypothetical protein GJQ69_06910 [Caproicibacterium lactatifermentans]QKO30690.1 hypothetical protein GKP14_06605 [Caproicibacterium lactatifermentans]